MSIVRTAIPSRSPSASASSRLWPEENGPGHRDAGHRVAAERLDREVRRQRGVDAAREPDHRARRQVLLAEVVADAEHERRLELRDRRGIGRDRRTRVEIEHLERRREVRERGAHAARRVDGEGRAVEDQLVVAADLVAEQDRDAVEPRERRHHLASLRRLADVERRGRAVRDEPRARRHELAGGIDRVVEHLGPGVLAHRHAEPREAAARRHRAPLRGRHEVALLVEDVVGREERLGLGCHAHAAAQQHRGVRERCGPRSRRAAPRRPRSRCAADAAARRVELAELVARRSRRARAGPSAGSR